MNRREAETQRLRNPFEKPAPPGCGVAYSETICADVRQAAERRLRRLMRKSAKAGGKQ